MTQRVVSIGNHLCVKDIKLGLIKQLKENDFNIQEDEFRLTYQTKPLDEKEKIERYDIGDSSQLEMRYRGPVGAVGGGLEDITDPVLRANMEYWQNNLQKALAAMTAENLRLQTMNQELMETTASDREKMHKIKEDQKNMHKDSSKRVEGLRKVVQNGSKELIPGKFSNVNASGSLKSWARELKDYARMADPATLNLFSLGETNIEGKVSLDQVLVETAVTPEVDQDLHYFICKFLDGESKMLSLNAEIGDLRMSISQEPNYGGYLCSTMRRNLPTAS